MVRIPETISYKSYRDFLAFSVYPANPANKNGNKISLESRNTLYLWGKIKKTTGKMEKFSAVY